MRLPALVVAIVVAGCSEDEPAPPRIASGPARIVVDIVEGEKRSEAAFSIRGGRLAPGPLSEARVYVRSGDNAPDDGAEYEEVYLVRSGEQPHRLTNDRNHDHSPRLAQDGRVVFVSCPFGDDDALPSCSFDAIEPESGSRKRLVADLGFVLNADLSRDGRTLLFTRYAAGFAPLGVFVLELGSDDERRISQGEFGRWSPDGERIAFDSDRDRNGNCLFHDCGGFATEVYVMDADGSNAKRLTNDVAVDAVFDWSADGEWILFGRIPDEDIGWDLWAIRADGACESRLTKTKRWEVGAKWYGGGHGGLAC